MVPTTLKRLTLLARTCMVWWQPQVWRVCSKLRFLPAGHIVYHGPRDEVLPFFESCGFKIPGRKAVPDFLQEVWHLCFVQRSAVPCPSSLKLSPLPLLSPPEPTPGVLLRSC